MFILAFILSLNLFAASESMNVFEQSFPRDNTFCSFKGKRVEILIRGMNKFTEPKERGYGEYLFYRFSPKKPRLMETNKYRTDSLKFFLGVSPICSKSHGYKIDDSTIAVLLKKENRPFKDKLVIQMFNAVTMEPKETLETNYLTEKAKKIEGGFAFSSFTEMMNPEIGKVQINNETFIFQEKDFPVWIGYTSKGFELLPDLTYDRSPWRKSFKEKKDFLEAAGWNEAEKKFTKQIVYLAINHKLKKKCLLLLEAKQKPVGNEAWICQTI